MATVQKPEADPTLAAVVTVFFDLGHVLINGQQKKWIYTTLVVHAGFLLCCLPGLVLRVLSVIDAYQTAQRLQAGEVVPENEYTYPPMFKVMSAIDKTATCARA
jgi:hypothetical protein